MALVVLIQNRVFGVFRQARIAEGFLDALGTRCPDAPVNREGLSQAIQSFVGVAVLEAGAAGSFQGARLLEGRAKVAGDG